MRKRRIKSRAIIALFTTVAIWRKEKSSAFARLWRGFLCVCLRFGFAVVGFNVISGAFCITRVPFVTCAGKVARFGFHGGRVGGRIRG